MLYDEAVLGEANGFNELCQYLEEYDNEWFIGGEDESWQRAILKETLHLFSMDLEKVGDINTMIIRWNNIKYTSFLISELLFSSCADFAR